MIVRLVKMTFQKDKVNDFLALFDEVFPVIKSFDGCVELKLLRDTNEVNVLMTYSIWQSEKDLDHYRFSEFFKHTWSKTKVLFESKAEARSFKIVA